MRSTRLRNIIAKLSVLALAFGSPAQVLAQIAAPPQSYTLSPLGVNLQDGSFTYTKADLSIGNLTLTRFWLGGRSGMQGYNFSGYVGQDSITVVTIGQMSVHFSSSGGTYLPWDSAAFGTSLTHGSGSSYVFTNRNGDVYTFGISSGPAVLTAIDYADGNHTDLLYNVNNQLRAVLSNQGYAIVLEYPTYYSGVPTTVCGYNTAQTYVSASSTCPGAPVSASYGVTGNQVDSVTDVRGNVTYYTYNATNHLMTCLSIPNSTSCKLSFAFWGNDPSHTDIYPSSIKDQYTGTGEHWQYGYSDQRNYDPRQPTEHPGATTYGNYTDPLGGGGDVTFYGYMPTTYVDGIYRHTYFTYSGTDLQNLTYPESNAVNYSYDDRGNQSQQQRVAKPGSGMSAITTSASFPPSDGIHYPPQCDPAVYNVKVCNKPLTKTDGNGNVTTYTYDPNSGQVATETGPAVGGVQPQTRYTYTQVFAGIKNSSGTIVTASTGPWLLTQESRCKTTAGTSTGCTGGTSDEVVTTYQYGGNGTAGATLLKGKVVDPGGLALRTCYGYDWQGNRIWETLPRAGLTSCP